MKILLGLLVAVFIALGAYYYVGSGDVSPNVADTRGEDMGTPSEAGGTSMMYAEENAVVISEQRPGATVTGMALLKAPGYIVIHADNAGQPGSILGASALLPEGESSGVKITLSRPSVDGEVLHAMLHFEKGGNTTFTATEDTPVMSALGGPISGWFNIAVDAPENVEISI